MHGECPRGAGQRRGVAVGRARRGKPPMLVADGPTPSLEAGARAAFLELLFKQATEAESTRLMVSHDERLAGRFDRGAKLEDVAAVSREAA